MYEELLIGLRGHAKRHGCDDRCPCYDAEDRGYTTCSEELAEKAADAIEELSKRVEELEAAQEISPEAKHFVDTKADNIIEGLQNLLASVKERRWIPVTERLPEEKQDGISEDVLMLVENPDGDITWKDVYVGYYLYDATSAETGWWAMMTCDCVKIGEHKHGDKVFPANEYVTHWMPLPEPPKEET